MNLHKSVTAIAGTMWNHGNTMLDAILTEELEWPKFEGSEMADLIAYLYFFNYQGSSGNPVLGKEIFEGKSCIMCHDTNDSLAIKQLKNLSTPTDLVKSMWNHVPYMHKLTVTKNINWPDLTSEDLRHLFTYLKSFIKKESN